MQIKPNKKVELVSPAGDISSLYSAIKGGADAVYFGVKGLNMRNTASNFDLLEIKGIISLLHNNKRKGYLALNTTIYNKELSRVEKILKEAKEARVDGVILWDMAVFRMARQIGIPIHLSTQASVSNFEALKFYADMGVKRVVLARECSLTDIGHIVQEIRKETLDCEVEVFVHGAMCVSISGRCFLSHASFSKSANRGECLQPCRREFLITDTEQKDNQYILGSDYVLSPRDLCTIDFLDRLIESGISAFKIEGRVRSPEYIRVVTSVYREAIDAFSNRRLNDKLKKDLKDHLAVVFNRGFTEGFYFQVPKDTGSQRGTGGYDKIFIGEVEHFFDKIRVAEVRLMKEGLAVGDEVLISGKKTPASFTGISELQINHRPVKSAQKGASIGVKVPFVVRPKDKVFLWRKKPNATDIS